MRFMKVGEEYIQPRLVTRVTLSESGKADLWLADGDTIEAGKLGQTLEEVAREVSAAIDMDRAKDEAMVPDALPVEVRQLFEQLLIDSQAVVNAWVSSGALGPKIERLRATAGKLWEAHDMPADLEGDD